MRPAYAKLRNVLKTAWDGVAKAGLVEGDKFVNSKTFLFPVGRIKGLPWDPERLLIRLIGSNMRKFWKAEKENDGWFPVTMKELEDEFTVGQQLRCFKQLTDSGFIERERRGIGAGESESGAKVKRFIRIDYDKVLKNLEGL
jgi:hypothetical protein